MGSPGTQRAISRWEIVGAWLHVWTPPRDVQVPPLPTRKLAGAALALLVLVGAALALLVPAIERGKRAGAHRLAAQNAAALRAETARLRADQRPHTLHVAAGRSAVAALEAGITADARARVRHHTISGTVLGTSCEASPAYDALYPQSRVYKCFVTTTTGHQGVLPGDRFGTGYPFVATVYTRSRVVIWCKENPRPDEKGRQFGDSRISPACAGKLSEVL
jgi:hypothetical protein